MGGMSDWVDTASNMAVRAAPAMAGAGLLASGGAGIANAIAGRQAAGQQARYFNQQVALANRMQAAAEQEQARRAGLAQQIAAYSQQPLNYDVNAFYQPITDAQREIMQRQYAADAAIRGLPRDSGAFLAGLTQEMLLPTQYQRMYNAQQQAQDWAVQQRAAQTGPLASAAGFAQPAYPNYPSMPQYSAAPSGDTSGSWALLAARQKPVGQATAGQPLAPWSFEGV